MKSGEQDTERFAGKMVSVFTWVIMAALKLPENGGTRLILSCMVFLRLKNEFMKLPKKFEKMSLDEQESILVKKLMETFEQERFIRLMLGKVRGKTKIQLSDIERPDLNNMKE